ncbi:hypothetical protein GP486_002487 [Trichoglossum hirsutum]|uniref:Uncharacterized protein n=1 Tax=Trichoglossum hirsutum TaxID=265104 RepID=A0A9P8RRM3_9PEZI|nr:hypothetical protein GP486_002487 [Trichoglossum hirsutum]
MKTTTFALAILGANSLGALAIPVESNDPNFQTCLDSGNTLDECRLAHSISRRDGNDVDFNPFHDCLDSGKTFDECRLAVSITKRDDVDFNPFHDCLDSGKTFDECRLAVSITKREQSLATRSDVTLVGRGWDGLIADFGRNWGAQSKCYTADKGHWLTNTAVRKLSTEACTGVMKQAATAGIGLFTKKLTGFYDARGGPIVKPGVKFLLSASFRKQTGIDFNLDTLGKDLCIKAIDHLMSDPGCTTPKKVGVITSHTAVNGGLFDWTFDGKPPNVGSNGVCSNCILSLILES